MADLIASLRTLILQSTDIADLVGSRVYSDQLPQTAQPPAVVLFVDREDAHDALDGPLLADSTIVRIECYGKTRIESDQLRRLLRAQIAGFYGVIDGVFIQSIAQHTGQKQETVRRRAGSDSYVWINRQDFRVWNQITEAV